MDGIEQQCRRPGSDLPQITGELTAILDKLRVVLAADRANLVPVDDPALDVLVADRAVLKEMEAGSSSGASRREIRWRPTPTPAT